VDEAVQLAVDARWEEAVELNYTRVRWIARDNSTDAAQESDWDLLAGTRI